jgi:type I site-specific restriction endonuclease
MAERAVIWDPLRKKEVARTPEEVVRQWFIGVLNSSFQVPLHMMMSEAGLKLGDKQFRADVLVYDRSTHPLLVVECKRPEVELTQEVLDQAIRYNMALDVKFMMITNGTRTFICEKQGTGYVFLDKVPTYNEMICQQQ